MGLRGSGRVTALMGAAVLASGCGGQTGSPVPQGAIAQARARGATSGDLLYVSMSDRTIVLTYPGLSKFGVAKGLHGVLETSDPNNGNVIVGFFEFAHGQTHPFARINPVQGQIFVDAAFDPTTDNIAYSVETTDTVKGNISVYKDLNSEPTVYTDPNMDGYGCITYDGQGNLFALAYKSSRWYLVELPKGGDAFVESFLDPQIKGPSNVLWDGTYVVIRSGSALYRVTTSGSTMTVVGKTKLNGAFGLEWNKFWIYGDTVFGDHLGGHNGQWLGLWHYPQGGQAYKILKALSNNKKDRIAGMTVSVAPKDRQ